MRPSGANNYLKWRRSIDEHLELRRLTWDEYGLFNWLCTKANPRTGTLRTSWPMLAEQTTLRVNYVGKLCGSLKRKGYVAYPEHRGRRGGLVEVAIDKFPLADGTYTTLAGRHGRTQSEVPADVPAEVLAEVPAELAHEKSEATRTSPSGRKRKRQRRNSLRVRSADAVRSPDNLLTKAEALAQAPAILRETLELFFLKTGREGLALDELEALRLLEQAHTPAVIQRAITTAVERFERRDQDPGLVTVRYLWESLRRYSTRKRPETQRGPEPKPEYPAGVTRLW